jgi:hypothetical protein
MRQQGSQSSVGWLSLLSAVVAVAALAAGCNDDLPVASRLERTRIVGARVQIAADPGRAAAVPGEAAVVEWLVAGPRAPETLTWAFAECSSVDSACADAAVPAATGTGAPVLAPFTAPAIDAANRPLMFGAVCEGGAPTLDTPDDTACAASSVSANSVRFEIPLAAEASSANRRPNLVNDALELDGAAWTTTPAGDAGGPCDATSGLPVVVAGTSQRHVRIVTDGDDRDSFAATPGSVPAFEALLFSSYSTAGKVDGSYESIAATDTRPDADVTIKWTPPAVADVPAAGLGVQFHFVVRDGRGGLDWVHRALCVVSP